MSENRLLKLAIAIIAFLVGIGVTALAGIDMGGNVPENLVTYTTSFSEATPNVKTYFTKYYFGNTKFEESEVDSAQVKFSCSGHSNPSEDYNKYEIGYSRYPAIFPTDMTDDTDGNFTCYSTSSGKYLTTDMAAVIDAFVNSSDGTINMKALGYDHGPKSVKFAIPDNGYAYRREVVDAIIYIISYGDDVTVDNKDEIKNKLDSLLSRAVVLKDYNNIAVDNNDSYIGIIPEFASTEISYTRPKFVYYTNGLQTPLSIYFHKSLDENSVKETVESTKNLSKLFTSTWFMGEITQKKNENQYYTADRIVCRSAQENLEELMGTGYWR